MNYKAILSNGKELLASVKEQYEKLTMIQKMGVAVLIVSILGSCAHGLGCACGEALYYIIH